MDFWHDLKTGKRVPNVVNVIVEIPKGSQNKYEYDKENKVLKLDRVLFSPFYYPGDYGIIPRTLCRDGDPLDAIVLVTNPSFPGILIEVRPIGVLKMLDSGKEDDKILAVPIHDPRFRNYKDINNVDQHVLAEIAHFFEVYKELEGKRTKIIGWGHAREAKKVIVEAVELYKKKFGKNLKKRK